MKDFNYKIIAIWSVLFLSSIAGCCPHKNVSGKIEGAEDVLITISGNGISTNTLTDGNYYFAGLEKGDYTIVPKKQDVIFTPGESSVTITNDDVYNIDFSKKVKDKYLYWVNRIGFKPSIGSIQRLKIPGGVRQEIVSGLNNLLGITVYQNYIYWVDSSKNGRIVEAKTDGSNQRDIFTNLGNVTDVAIRPNVRPKQVFWIETIGENQSKIRKGRFGSGDIDDIRTGLRAPFSLEIDLKNDRLYWTDSMDGISWVSLDGMDSGRVIGGQPFFATLDIENRQLYYSTAGGHSYIKKVNTDGTQSEDLIGGTLERVNGIVLDTEGQKLYWTQKGGEVVSADQNGTNMEVVNSQTGTPYDIDISEQ
ncbi:hypothetical protein [Desulforhopalus sp. 52FAK]